MNKVMAKLRGLRWGWYVAALVVAGAFAAGYQYRDTQRTASAPLFLTSANADVAGVAPGGYADIVKKTAPAVVNVETVTEGKRTSGRQQQRPEGMEDFFNFFGGPEGQQRAPRKQQGLGSGVIMSADGYVLTNNHVIDGATSVKVVLRDKREFDAKVVGGDRESDIAVLKLEATGLPVLPVGNSDRIEIGDIALAIGNPFGVGQTVTMGIISATGRRGFAFGEGGGQIEDFIQTDAAINRGNSGGALVNSRGELIGINSAIITPSGGSAGVGFAIPVNMARDVMTQLVKGGKVARGYLGITPQRLDAGIASASGLEKSAGGAIVADVRPGSPAAKAGVQEGDIIRTVNGTAIEDPNELVLRVSRNAPGTVAQLGIRRDGKDITVPVTLATRPSINEQGEAAEAEDEKGVSSTMSGVTVDTLTPGVARQFRLGAEVTGVVVTEVDPDSSAADSGLRPGDVIQKVNRQPVATVSDFNRAVTGFKGKAVILQVNRQGRSFFIGVESK